MSHSTILSGEQYACGVGLDFNGADCSPSEDLATEYSSTSAREKSQLIHTIRERNRLAPSHLTFQPLVA